MRTPSLSSSYISDLISHRFNSHHHRLSTFGENFSNFNTTLGLIYLARDGDEAPQDMEMIFYMDQIRIKSVFQFFFHPLSTAIT